MGTFYVPICFVDNHEIVRILIGKIDKKPAKR